MFKRLSLAVLASLAPPALAGDAAYTYTGTGAATERELKAFDPVIRPVSSLLGAEPGTTTDCGAVEAGETVAFYCPAQRTILISQQTMDAVGRKFGHGAIALMVAHEFAHARQHAVQGFAREFIWTSVVDELQADCVAGAYLHQVEDFRADRTAINEAMRFLEAIGDYIPLEKDWHGTPGMRRNAFAYGYQYGDLGKCLAATDWNLRTILNAPSGMLERQLRQPGSSLNQWLQWGNDVMRTR